jgi:hypothetical protein
MILPENRRGQGPPGPLIGQVDTSAFVRDGYVAVRGAIVQGLAPARG